MIADHVLVVESTGVLLLDQTLRQGTRPVVQLLNASLTYAGAATPTLSELSFELAAGEIVAVVGPSGAGKSTLCNALVGEMSCVSGEIRLAEIVVPGTEAGLSEVVSLVPQTPELYDELTVRSALEFAAELRLARDVSRSERQRRVQQIIHKVQLEARSDARIDTLSGGQLKRVSMAMELLTNPLLLILDEPTSGLDEGLDRRMMELLRDIAGDGTAVVLVTHSTANLRLAHKVLAINQAGRVAFLAKPDGLLEAFAVKDYADLMDALRREAVASMPQPSIALPLTPALSLTTSTPPRGSFRRHWRVLVLREFARQRATLQSLLLTLVAFPLVGAFLAIESSPGGLRLMRGPGVAVSAAQVTSAGHVKTVLLVLVVCLCFFPMAQSFSSLVVDQAVLRRERRWGVSTTSVLSSRVIAFLPAAIWISSATLAAFFVVRPAPSGTLLPHATGLFIAGWVLSVSSMLLGLLVSSATSSLRQAVFVLMGILAVQVVFTGVAIPLDRPGVLSSIAYLIPSRWGMAAASADIGVGEGASTDPLWAHDLTHVLGNLAVLLLITAASFGLALILLARRTKARS